MDEPDQSRKLLVGADPQRRPQPPPPARGGPPPRRRPGRRSSRLPAGTASVEEAIEAAEQHLRLAGCLGTLAEVQRAVVTLRMLDEVPGEDVARLLGISAGHVAVLLHRAKANLLQCMTA